MSKRIHLVLVPGLLSTEEVWRAQIENLKEFCDVRVTLQNLHHDTLEAMAEGILAESPPQFAIAGSSMGGYLATLVEKIGGPRITHLCLIGGIINPQSDIQRKVYKELLEYAERGEFEAIKRDLPSMFLNADNQTNVTMVNQVHDMAETVGL
ncbi:MAG: alpha/beta hydrolase, partial [Pseudomonadota bacterium]|nr:alpha/beta hydrolase [Pseudomonadota bacterium]